MSLLQTRIDLDAIAHNARLLRERIGSTKLMAVVKADAYNHGVERVVRVLEPLVDSFGVVTPDEAVEVEALTSRPVLSWLWLPGPEAVDALASGVQLGVPSLWHARKLVDAEIPATVHMMVETGMHRSGIDPQDWDEAFNLLRDAPHLKVLGMCSHLASADDPASPITALQKEQFDRAIARGRELGLELPLNHLANSPGTLLHEDLHYEQVRPGLALYGVGQQGSGLELRPAMSWVARVSVVKPVRSGESVSYGHTWTAREDGWIAVVTAGYADGVPRSAQDRIEVGIGAQRYRQVGRVCMDQILVDLGTNPLGVAPGDEAVLFGEGGMSAEEFAAAIGTIPYEVLTLPKGRTVRDYQED